MKALDRFTRNRMRWEYRLQRRLGRDRAETRALVLRWVHDEAAMVGRGCSCS